MGVVLVIITRDVDRVFPLPSTASHVVVMRDSGREVGLSASSTLPWRHHRGLTQPDCCRNGQNPEGACGEISDPHG